VAVRVHGRRGTTERTGLPLLREALERPRRRTGYSSDGLRFTDVTEAFRAAEEALGTGWKVRGRNHCERVTLRPRYVRYAAAGSTSWERFYRKGSIKERTIFPRAVVLKAAELLGVHPDVLIGREC